MSEGATLAGDPVRPLDGINEGGRRAIASRLEAPGGCVAFPPGITDDAKVRLLQNRVNELARIVAYLLRGVHDRAWVLIDDEV